MVGDRIRGFDAEEESTEHTRNRHGTNDAGDYAKWYHRERPSEQELQQVVTSGAERHADADLAGAGVSVQEAACVQDVTCQPDPCRTQMGSMQG